MLLLDPARRRHHRGDGVADLIQQRRIMLGDHVVEGRAAARGHVAALARDLFGLLRLVIGRRVRAEGNLHRVGKAQMLQRFNHLADADAAELSLDGRRKAGVNLFAFIANRLDDIRNHRDIGNRGERAGDGAVAAGDALGVIDGTRGGSSYRPKSRPPGRSARRGGAHRRSRYTGTPARTCRTHGTYPGR